MVPEEACLFRWALRCVVALAAVAFNAAQDGADNNNNIVALDRAVNGPAGKLIRGHFPSGGLGPPPPPLLAATAKSPNVRRLILGEPSVGIVQMRPDEIPEQGAKTQMVRPPQQQQQQQQHMGGGGHFVIQTQEQPDGSPEEKPSVEQDSQIQAPTNVL